jgi:hypothetical protein
MQQMKESVQISLEQRYHQAMASWLGEQGAQLKREWVAALLQQKRLALVVVCHLEHQK